MNDQTTIEVTEPKTRSGRRLARWLTVLMFLSAGLFLAGRAVPPWPVSGLLSETQALWEQHRAVISAPGGLIHHFAFLRDESLATMGQDEVSLWKKLVPPKDTDPRNYKFVSGRWPGKYAIQLDQSPLEIAPPQFDRAFTVQMWLRHHRPGLNPGPNSDIDATILALGDGVWSGFRFWLRYPHNVLMFDVGQPKPNPAISLAAQSRLCPQTWHHIAATWDGKFLSLYVDGLLSDRVQWDGEFHNARKSSRLRIGFTGNGLGSAIQDVDEIAVYNICLSDQQIFQSALSGVSVPETEVNQLTTAIRNAWEHRSEDPASLRNITSDDGLTTEVRAAAGIRLSEMQRANSIDTARESLGRVQELTDKAVQGRVLLNTYQRTALHESICVATSDKIATHYLPHSRDRANPSFDANSIVSFSADYDQAVDNFRRELARRDLTDWKNDYEKTHQAFLRQHCERCHNTTDASGGLNLELLSSGESVSRTLDELERIAQVLSDRTMPPEGNPVPPERSVRSFITWLEGRPSFALCEELETDESTRNYQGYIHSRRLTRLEFRNAIRDLLGVTLSEADLPSQDGFGGEGFDNVGDILFTGTSQIEDYLHSTSVALTEARRNNCRWVATSDNETALDCLSPESLRAFCRMAWRRPVASEEINQLQELLASGRTKGLSHDQCIILVYQSILMSPNFLFVLEPAPESQGVYRLSPHELATRLSIFLWSSIPDEELLGLADSGQILNPTIIEQQISRMLSDSRASALGEAFGLQWLGLLDNVRTPDSNIFPEFDADLAHDMDQEVIRYVTSIFSENRSIVDLLDSNWTIVNPRLAKHYGLSTAPAGWSKVQLEDQRRGGVLTMGAVLTKTSYSHRTSPVLRGQWVLNSLLGRTVPPPPPNVPSLDAGTNTEISQTMRARLEQHREDPACANCHSQMDPLGFALENYDAIGRWRTEERGLPIDSSSTLPDGTRLNGAGDLKGMLNASRDEFLKNFVRKLLGFAVGRGLSSFDDCVVDRCLEQLKANGYHSHVLVREICLSRPFQYRYTPRESSATKAASLAGDRP